MRLSTYAPLATRTESVLDPASLSTEQDAALRALRMLLEHDLVALGAKLDRLKRIAFYGKSLPMPEALDPAAELRDPLPLNAAGLRLLHAITGLATETAELAEALTHRDAGTPIDPVNLAEELGDVHWYAAIAAEAMHLDGDAILEANLAKLQARYPDRFSSEHAEHRDLDLERAALLAHTPEAVEARIAAVLRRMFSAMVPETLPQDLTVDSALPPATVRALLDQAVQTALDTWTVEAAARLRLSISEADLTLLEARPAKTDEDHARERLLHRLGTFGLNQLFNHRLEEAIRAGALSMAEATHAMTGTIPEG